MEIIHIILGKGNPQRMNGVNKVVNELATRQIMAGEKAQVWGITANPVHDYPQRVYQTMLYKARRNPFILDPELKKDILDQSEKAVFHLHGGFIPAMYSTAMWLKRNKILFVFTAHGSYNTIAMQKSWLNKKLYFMLFEKHMLKAAGAIHSLGKSEISGLQNIFANNKSVLIPYGFELPDAVIPQKNNSGFIIGYCGRLDIYTKGLKELLIGFSIFHWQKPEAKLWIIGDGPGKEKLVKIARLLKVGESVVFHGAKFGDEKNHLLQQCDVFAAPSRNEGLPTAVLEAASMGIPCLVTEATNTGDYVRAYDAGLVISKTNSNEISKGFETLYRQMEDPVKRSSLGANARRMVAEAFDWNLIVGKFEKLYQV
jgi:glycosyltransferase involved in cell wall biosynthesis